MHTKGKIVLGPRVSPSGRRCREWTRHRVDSVQRRRLRRLIDHAYANVPFYREHLDRAGVSPAEIRDPADLAAVPPIDKARLRERPVTEILARGVDPAKLVRKRTSGTTGQPFSIWRTRGEQLRWLRSWHRDMRAWGRRISEPAAAVFSPRGDTIEKRARRVLRALGIGRVTQLDCTRQPDEILARLRADRTRFIYSLPGVLHQVAMLMTDSDRALIRPRAIYLTGEPVTESMRRQIATGFDAVVATAYGSMELGLAAFGCAETGSYHVRESDVIMQIVKEDGSPAGAGERGELVATALGSFAAPFIRYRTGDLAVRSSAACACGCELLSLDQIEGREIDSFRLGDGRLLHPFGIVGYTVENAPWVGQYQLVQEEASRVLLRAVPAPRRPDLAHTRRFEEGVRRMLGPGVDFRVEFVDDVERAPGGKARLTIPLASRSRHDPAD